MRNFARAFARTALVAVTLSSLALGAAACGGAKDSVSAKTAASVSAEQIDADPVALLPGSPLASAHIDARLLLGTSYGESLGRLLDKAMPVGEETGFLPSRDIDTLWAASYSSQGVDGLAVLTGKFDEKKLADAADKRTQTRGGGLLVKSTYAERSLYTVSNVGICVLTSKTALVGSETAIRRALDRIRDGRLQRSVPAWMLDTLSTPGAAFAGAGDFDSQPLPPDIKAQIPVSWLRNVKTAKIVGTPDAGVRVKAHLSYGSADDAQGGERGLRQAQTMASVLSVAGVVPKMQDVDIKSDGNDVDCAFHVDERGLSSLISVVQRWIGG